MNPIEITAHQHGESFTAPAFFLSEWANGASHPIPRLHLAEKFAVYEPYLLQYSRERIFPLTQDQYDNFHHYDRSISADRNTLTLTWHDDTLARLHGANELMELEDALAHREGEETAIFDNIGVILSNVAEFMLSNKASQPPIARRINTQTTALQREIRDLQDTRAAKVVEYNEFLHRLITAYAIGLGSGRHWNEVNKIRAKEVACYACEQYWTLGGDTDDSGLMKPSATWLDPRGRIVPKQRLPRLTRMAAMQLAEVAAKAYAAAQLDSHWEVGDKPIYGDNGETFTTKLTAAGKAALAAAIKEADESRRDPAKPEAIDDLQVTATRITAERPTAKAALVWTLPNDGGSPIIGIDVEYVNAVPASSPTRTRLAADALTHSVTGLAAGTWIFRARAVNALGEGDWASVTETIAGAV